MDKRAKGLAAYKAAAEKAQKEKAEGKIKPEAPGSHQKTTKKAELGAEYSDKSSSSNSGKAGSGKEKPLKSTGAPKTLWTGGGDPKVLEGLLKAQKGGGSRKAAKLLLLLGKDQAAEVIRHLPPEDLEGISAEIARIRQIEKVEAQKLLEEFGTVVKRIKEPRGGMEAAMELLVAAFGEEKGKVLFNRAIPLEGRRPFAFLDDVENHQIHLLLKSEPVMVIALILGFIDKKKASAIIRELTPDQQKEVILRLGRMKKVDPIILEKIEEVLKERLRTQGRIITEGIDGASALAEILKYMNLSQEERILKEMGERDEELTKQVKDKIFTIDVLFQAEDSGLQAILRDFSDHELAVLIKGKTARVKDRILSCVSERRRGFITEEQAHLGSMKRADVDRATKDFLDYLRQMEKDKKLVIYRENEYFVN